MLRGLARRCFAPSPEIVIQQRAKSASPTELNGIPCNCTPQAGKLFTAKMYVKHDEYVFVVVATPGKCNYWWFNPDTRIGLAA